MIALLLDLANIFGGYLLAVPLLAGIPQIGDDVARTDRLLRPFAWVVGVVALVAGGFYAIVHLTEGRLLHFEVVGIAVGVALLWERLTGRPPLAPDDRPVNRGGTATGLSTSVQGKTLLLAVFGLIAIVVGIQGLFTPN